MGFEAILQGGYCVEASEPPEYCPLQGSHVGSPPTNFRMDAWWRIKGVRKGESERESHRSGGSSSMTSTQHLILYLAPRCRSRPHLSPLVRCCPWESQRGEFVVDPRALSDGNQHRRISSSTCLEMHESRILVSRTLFAIAVQP